MTYKPRDSNRAAAGTNLSLEHDHLIQQTKAKHHRFVYNKELTQKAVKELLDSMSYKMHEL